MGFKLSFEQHFHLLLFSRPKSPPNSPNPELALHPLANELRGVYINKVKDSSTQHPGGVTASDIVWDWTSRPNIPQK